MKTKYTAIDWVEEQFIWMIEDGVDFSDSFHTIMAKFLEAKKIEKQQIKDAFLDGFESLAKGNHQYSEDYYQEKYGNDT